MMLFTQLPTRRRIGRPSRILSEPIPFRGSTPEALRLSRPLHCGLVHVHCPKSPPPPKPSPRKPPLTGCIPPTHSSTNSNHRVRTHTFRSKRHAITKHLDPTVRKKQVSGRPSTFATSSTRSRTGASGLASIIKVLPLREITMAWILSGVLELSFETSARRSRIS